MRRGVAYALPVVLAWSSALPAKDPMKAVYCVRDAGGSWSLSRFKPLIDVRQGTVFAELLLDGAAEAKLRRFYPDSELTFDYTFDASGRLAKLWGSVQVRSAPPAGVTVTATEPLELADWVGEADLSPGSDGKIPAHHVLYSRENDRIDKPDKAEAYVGRFEQAPVYRTQETVPCAAKWKEFREAEKKNATQE